MGAGHPSGEMLVFGMRKIKFVNGEFYHVYNRGTDKRVVFQDNEDFERFLQSMEVFNTTQPVGSLFEYAFADKKEKRWPKLVNIVCYCLNKNHYHLIFEQLVEGGISEFMKRIGGGFTNYFNFKNHRSGILFQGRFKAAHIDSNEYLLHVSAYVSLNNQVHRRKGDKYRSSWQEYLGRTDKALCFKDIILNQFKNKNEYRNFAENSLKSILERKDLLKELEIMLLD
ncbi:MAG: Transposase [Candidatus Giovannonibacteria bacterium GW2011_GWA2_44_13b]|uniref:Transposase n=2 Tax=Candidatus Giovannoniibacteriota TaxID=1752738 RepID=A0A0G1K2B5_9BACT|nr:MAG: Transposase [Candidatus Giovannonibacteria bacterium GW2011_GWA2_44_13b]